MRTMCRPSIGSYLSVVVFLAATLVVFGFQGEAQAQHACGTTAAPQCDGYCPGTTQACVDTGGSCACVPTAGPCGTMAGSPQCWGDCPTSTPVCVDAAGVCTCVVPTLSEWGVIGMSIVMFGGVLFLRRRQTSGFA